MEDYIKDFIFVLDKIKVQVYKRSHEVLQSLLISIPDYCNNIIDIFIRTSLIEKDPYGYEQFDVFTVPRETALVGGNPALEMFQRLNCLQHSYRLLSNQIQQNAGVPDSFLENCHSLLENIYFSQLSQPNTNTKFVRQLYTEVMDTKDEQIREVLEHNFKLLAENHAAILNQIEKLSRFNREYYKLSIRYHLFPLLDGKKFSGKAFKDNPTAFLSGIKQMMPLHTPDIPYIDFYMQDSVHDYFNKKSENVIELLKNRYLSEAEIKKLPRTQRLSLVNLIKSTDTANDILYNLLYLLDQSYKMYVWHNAGPVSRLLYMLRSLFKMHIIEKPVTIQFFDPLLGKIIKEKTTFSKFKSQVAQTHKELSDLHNPESGRFTALTKSTPREMAAFFKKSYFDIYLVKEKSIGFNNCFLTLLKNSYSYLKQISSMIKQLDDLIKELHKKHKEYTMLFNRYPTGKK